MGLSSGKCGYSCGRAFSNQLVPEHAFFACSVRIILDRESGRPKGYGFVNMAGNKAYTQHGIAAIVDLCSFSPP
jgi:hypothetical protein